MVQIGCIHAALPLQLGSNGLVEHSMQVDGGEKVFGRIPWTRHQVPETQPGAHHRIRSAKPLPPRMLQSQVGCITRGAWREAKAPPPSTIFGTLKRRSRFASVNLRMSWDLCPLCLARHRARCPCFTVVPTHEAIILFKLAHLILEFNAIPPWCRLVQSIMNARLSQHRCWPWHENGPKQDYSNNFQSDTPQNVRESVCRFPVLWTRINFELQHRKAKFKQT